MSIRHLLPLFLLAGLACTPAADPNTNAAKNTVASTPSAAHGTVATPIPAKTTAASPEPTDAEFEGTAGIIEKKNPNVTEVATLREVRSARHETYDRIVFEFAGSEMPTYHIEYIDKPVRACGSGDVVPLAGD
ncbi:MAG: hypothetical protein H0V76_06600, partial [Blastocatellia bacterium]|nr:hypothetical protein [Blastocatellia bacterium]